MSSSLSGTASSWLSSFYNGTNISTLLGITASFVAVLLWIVTFHKRFFVSLWKTDKVTAYGVYATFSEAIRTHFTYLAIGLVPTSWTTTKRMIIMIMMMTPASPPPQSNKQQEQSSSGSDPYSSLDDRDDLERQVELAFRREFFLYDNDKNNNGSNGNVIISHSCRSIFYYVIRSLLNNAKQEALLSSKTSSSTPSGIKIRICLGSLHFGSFYRLLKGIEKSMTDDTDGSGSGSGCTIEFYEIDFHADDWTLDQDSIDEEQFQSCDLLLVQHVFGQPLNHDRLVTLAKKHNIPILEDCVQSGSLFSKYRGYAESDIVMYSGGLDKTPPCFGGGFAMFRNTPWGDKFYHYCSAIHNVLPVDSWTARFWTCFNITLHLMIAKNQFGFNNLLGLVSYVWVTERGEYINWYAISLKVRKAKIITPFQHAESGFLRKPSTYQLQSMLYGLSKRADLQRMSSHEVEGRELLLSVIPPKYRRALFPFLTQQVMDRYRSNAGVSEFSWVVSPIGDRTHLCQYLNDHFIVSLINTTWETADKTKSNVARQINNNLIYLPNINEMNTCQMKKVGTVLTSYCQELESTGEYVFDE